METSIKNKKGFTLVELLVVIAIIGLLSSVAVVALSGSRVKARDTKRAADLRQIMTALELYQSDVGHYPITATYSCFDCASYINTAILTPASTNITTALAPYMIKPPIDPLGTGNSDQGYLFYSTDGVSYKLFSWRRPENLCNYAPALIDSNRCGTVTASCGCSTGNPSVGFWGGPNGLTL